jgi:hypothetical protein
VGRIYLIILILVASMVTYTIWYVSNKNAEMLSNRVKEYAVEDWRYTPCDPTTESCGRRE